MNLMFCQNCRARPEVGECLCLVFAETVCVEISQWIIFLDCIPSACPRIIFIGLL